VTAIEEADDMLLNAPWRYIMRAPEAGTEGTMSAMRSLVRLVAILAVLLVAPAGAQAARVRTLAATVDQLLALEVRPFAIAHRGLGNNLGEDPSRPIENTAAAVEAGFKAGASVVEVDVQLTLDRRVVLYHDDFLPDHTCISQLTLAQLRARLPDVSTLEEILEITRHFNGTHPLRGILIVELKAAAPLCDPNDRQDHAIVSTVSHVIRQARMTSQVLFTSLSPALLYLARHHAPEIDRILSLVALQFLTEQEARDEFGAALVFIHKKLNLGLQWVELGGVFRLPGYRSLEELLRTAAITQARVVEAELLLLRSNPILVAILNAAGYKVLGFTAEDDDDWTLLDALGVDGIYTNDVPLGVERQAAIP
jgi:glycerophosphoryl diester phosphodiesterase